MGCHQGHPRQVLSFEFVLDVVAERLDERTPLVIPIIFLLFTANFAAAICVSPKATAPVTLSSGNELKLVYPQPSAMPDRFSHLQFDYYFLQPMDGPAVKENTQATIDYCKSNPQWRLSIQMHKLVGLP